MMDVRELIGAVITLLGSIFIFSGALGILRMPDSYNRIQAGTKATTLGTLLTVLGIGVYHPDWLSKVVLLILFILLTNPVSSHVLARAAHFIGVPLAEKTVLDKLKEKREQS